MEVEEHFTQWYSNSNMIIIMMIMKGYKNYSMYCNSIGLSYVPTAWNVDPTLY